MLIPILVIGAAALATYGVAHFMKSRAQSHTAMSAKGPVTVVTAVPKTVTPEQANMTPAVNTQQAASAQAGTHPVVISQTGVASTNVSPNSVLTVQRALNALGIQPVLKEDGLLGPATEANVKQYQNQIGQSPTGAMTPTLTTSLSDAMKGLAAPQQAVGTSATVVNATTSPASISSAKDVQHALNLLGASPKLAEDGVIGPISVAAIKSFQTTHGLVSDGIAGPKTKTALGVALSQQGQAAA